MGKFSSYTREFSQLGTDFAGSFLVKTSSRRNAPSLKGYLCLFVSMATKAVYLEFVSSLTTNAFLACLDRFVARRGLPQTIYSENGTNYFGASRHLKEIYTFLRLHHDQLYDLFSQRSVDWRFNPPSAPNFGGLWEAAVKSVKNLLKGLIHTTSHTFEEYCTLLARIEAILNSRPLGRCSTDPGIQYLTPGDFLIGDPLLSCPEEVFVKETSCRNRWDQLKRLQQAFWKSWSSEYLQTAR